MLNTTKTLGAFAAASLLALAACGGDDASSTPATTAPAATAEAATFADGDVDFAQGMIPHHEQAIEMADIALDPTVGAGDEVVDLAQRVKAGQDPEIAIMSAWLTAWGQPIQMDMSDGHDMSAMDGMMSVEDMDTLAASTGADFDRMWIEMMIRHHEGAIAMAERATTDAVNPEVVALAEAVIDAQQGEIEEMNALLGS